jgi:hypothetical protein
MAEAKSNAKKVSDGLKSRGLKNPKPMAHPIGGSASDMSEGNDGSKKAKKAKK